MTEPERPAGTAALPPGAGTLGASWVHTEEEAADDDENPADADAADAPARNADSARIRIS